MKIIRLRNSITVILDDGTLLTNNSCTDELYNEIVANQDNEEEVRCLMIPEFCKKKEEIEVKVKLLNDLNESKLLTVAGSSVYIKSISELSVPEDLAVALFKAEQEGNEELVQTYLNFWTLCSLNPDSRARTNLFWFLNRYGMTISKSGLFIAYRNVKLKKEGKSISSKLAKFVSEQYFRVKTKLKKAPVNYFVGEGKDGKLFIYTYSNNLKNLKASLGNLKDLYFNLSNEEEAPVYTDSYSGKFTIKIGEVVSMPRDKCDAVQENTCSRGLHVAGKSWLQSGYFGQISLVVLVNPADVVAVPPQDSYGKMRCCAYYPIQLVDRDEEGNIIDNEIPDGFEDDFMHQIAYNGVVNNEDSGNYKVLIPEIPELSKKHITNRLVEISRSLEKKLVN